MQDAAAETLELVDRLRRRDVRAIARGISLIEDHAPQATDLLSACFPDTGRALTLGVTGPPGAGKSSLVDQLSRHYLQQKSTVAVVAVDPSSPYTGGALLGDRIRMQEHHADPCFYLRSMATRGALGGLAPTTADAASVLDAAGFDRIFIETVGVGQDEIDIVRLADITLVVLVPGMGDDVQSIKAGILEVADIFVINKSDHDGADRLEAELRAMQSLAEDHTSWLTPIVRTTSTTGEGISTLLSSIEMLHDRLKAENRMEIRRRTQWKHRLPEMVQRQLVVEARLRGLGDQQLAAYVEAIVRRTENPYRLVPEIVADLMRRT